MRRFRGDNGERGAVLPIVALSLVTLMVMTAFSVDIGRQIMRRREAQATADLIALDMTRMIDGRTRQVIEADPNWDQTRRDASARNNFPEAGVTAVLGHWDKTNQTFTASGASDIPDSVQVTAQDTVNFFFARVIGINQGNVSRAAVAMQGPSKPTPEGCEPPVICTEALGELGSVFAGFQYYNDPGMTAQYNLAAELRAKVLNASLFTQLGVTAGGGVSSPPTGLSLDALSYKGIANGSVRLGDLASTLGFGSVDNLLSATLTARQLLTAEATILQSSSSAADVTAGNKLATFASRVSNTLTLQLGKFIRIQQGKGNRAANARVNALNLITGAAQVINGKNFFSTTIATNIPGAPTVPLRVSIIEPAQSVWNAEGSGPCSDADYNADPLELPLGCGPRTAQVRVATSIPTTLDLTPYGIPVIQATTIPIVFEAASAQSFFTAIRCAQPTSGSTTDFRVLTNGVSMTIGSVTDAALQSSNSMSVQGQALLTGSINLGLVTLDLGALTAVNESKTFKNGAVYTGDMVTNAGILGADETHRFVGNTFDNIVPTSWRYAGGVGNTSISTTMFNNLGITNGLLNTAVSNALKSSLNNLDSLLMDPVLSSFGATIAGADGAIRAVDCEAHLVK